MVKRVAMAFVVLAAASVALPAGVSAQTPAGQAPAQQPIGHLQSTEGDQAVGEREAYVQILRAAPAQRLEQRDRFLVSREARQTQRERAEVLALILPANRLT